MLDKVNRRPNRIKTQKKRAGDGNKTPTIKDYRYRGKNKHAMRRCQTLDSTMGIIKITEEKERHVRHVTEGFCKDRSFFSKHLIFSEHIELFYKPYFGENRLN